VATEAAAGEAPAGLSLRVGRVAAPLRERASPAQLDALRAAFAQVERDTREGADIQAMLRAKTRFYEVLLDGARNATVQAILSGLQTRVGVLRTASLSLPGRPARAVAEIRAIVDAIEAQDADEAARACARHVEEAAAAGLAALGAPP
jgi:DNA-binding GntR family transcriptional regulator